MKTVTCDIRDLPLSERSALERIVGHQLRETTQIIVNVVDVDVSPAAPIITPLEPDVPELWKIYDGLSEEEIETLDQVLRQRANLTRDFE